MISSLVNHCIWVGHDVVELEIPCTESGRVAKGTFAAVLSELMSTDALLSRTVLVVSLQLRLSVMWLSVFTGKVAPEC